MVNNNDQKKKKKYFLGVIFLIIMLVLTLLLFAREFNLRNVLDTLKESTHKMYLGLAFVLMLLYFMFYGLCVNSAVRSHGEKTSIVKGFIYGCMDFFYSAITPSASGGQPAVILYMAKDGVSYSFATISVILQTAIFKIVLLTYNIIGIFVIGDVIFTAKPVFLVAYFIGFAVSLLMISLCFLSMFYTSLTGKVGRSLIRFGGKIRLIRHTDKKLASFEKTLCEYRAAADLISEKKMMLVKMFLYTFLQRSCFFAISFIVYKSFDMSGYGFLQIVCLQSAVALAVDSIPVPGGIGANEIALYILYNRVYGTGSSLIPAAIILTRLLTYFAPLAVSAVFTMTNHVLGSFRRKRLEK